MAPNYKLMDATMAAFNAKAAGNAAKAAGAAKASSAKTGTGNAKFNTGGTKISAGKTAASSGNGKKSGGTSTSRNRLEEDRKRKEEEKKRREEERKQQQSQKSSVQKGVQSGSKTGQEKSRSRTLAQFLMEQAVPEQKTGMTGQEASRNRVTNRNYLAETVTQPKTEEKKSASGKTYEQLTQRANQLQREKELVLASGGTAANVAGYDARIADLLMQAQQLRPEEKKGPSRHSQSSYSTQTKTNADRDKLLAEYNKAVEAERAAAGYAADGPGLAEAAKRATDTRKELEERLKDLNRKLGNPIYEGLADESRPRDMFEGWAGDRAAGSMAAVGTGLEWAGTNLGINPLTDAGATLFGGAKDIRAQAEKDWGSATEDMSNTGKTIANIGKTVADMTMDMVDNFIVPGSGRLAMGLRAGGFGALTQDERENNDINSRMGKAAMDGALAYLSEYLVGGAEAVYGKSVLGKAISQAVGNLSKPVQYGIKTILNTEGLEEGLEYALGYLGDRYLGFDQEAAQNFDPRHPWRALTDMNQSDRDELWQNVAVGYIVGVLFNGVAGGISYDAKHIRNVVDEAIEAADSGMTPEQIVQTAMLQPNEDVKIEAGKQRTDMTALDIGQEAVGQQVQPAAQTEAQAETQQSPEKQQVVDILLSESGKDGGVSNSQANKVLANPALVEAFKEVTGVDLNQIADRSEQRNAVKTMGVLEKARQRMQGTQQAQTSQEAQNTRIPYLTDPDTGLLYTGKPQQNIDAGLNPGYNGNTNSSEVITDGRTGSQSQAGAGIPGGQGDLGTSASGGDAGNGSAPLDRGILLSNEAKAKLQERGVTVVELSTTADSAAFSAALDAARNSNKNGWAVSPKSVDDLSAPGTKIFLSQDGSSGLVISPDGDIEAVFANPEAGAPKGVTKSTIPQAIANGGVKLDCYGPVLANIYAQYGFVPVARVKFNPEYANPGWDPSKGTPDIFVMMHNGDTADTVVENYGNYAHLTQDQLNNLPLMEYDEAMAYRDWRLERRNAQNTQTEQTAAEPQNEPTANPAPQGAEIPPTGQESNTGGLTAPETNAETQTAQEEAKTAPGTGKEKVSQFFSNTLTNREGESVGDPLTYLTKSEAETLQNAVNRLNMNGEAEMGTMLATTMWNDEQVKMAKVIGSALFNDSEVSGDKTAYNAWRKIEREHATAIARALRAYGSDPEMEVNAESIARMAERYLSLVEDGAVPEVGKLSKEQIQEARTRSEEATSELAKLEAAEKQHVDSGLSGDEAFEKVKDGYLNLAQKLVAQRNVGLLWDNILGRNKALRNGVEGVMTRLRKILAKQDADYIRRYVQSNVAAQTGDLKYQAGLTADGVGKWINSLQKLCQLFGTGTTLRNTEGNVLFGTLDFLSNDIAGAAADSFLSLFTGNRTRGIETGVFGGKNRSASRTAVEHSILEIAANMDMSEDGKYIGSGQSAFNPYKIGGRFLQRANQVLSYALNATDAAAVGMAKQSAADAAQRANRHSGGNMTEETAARIGEQEAAYRAFKNETTPQKVLEFLRDALDLIGVGGEKTKLGGVTVGRKGGFGAGTLIAPYIGVPVNIAMKGVEYSPIGAAIGVKNAAAAAKMAKGASPNSKAMQDSMVLQNKAAGQIGRGVLGTALTVLLASLMKQAKEEDKEWFKNWDMETDPDVRAQNKAEGKSGQQINMSMLTSLLFDDETNGAWLNGDDLVNISSIEPLNQYLGLASLLADDDDALDVKGYLKALAAATGDSMEDLPSVSWLGQISDTINYNPVYETKVTMDEEGNLREERVEDKWATGVNAGVAMLGNALSGFIPAPVRHASAASDEYQRDTKGENAAETAWNQIVAATPWRQNLPVKTDNYGNPISQGDLATRLANQYLANKYTEVNQSEVSREVERLREETGVDLTPDRTGPKSQSFGKGKDKEDVKLDAEDSRAWKNAYGKAFEELMTEMMGSKTYTSGSADSQTELGSVMKNFAKDSIKKDFAEYYGLPYESQYDEIRKLDDPAQYLAIHERWNEAVKNEDWDAADMLLQASMSSKDQEYMREHTGKFGTYLDFAQDGVSARKADQYQTELKDLYTSEDRSSANGYDILRTVANGDYTAEEADAIMNRQKSDGSYYAGKGRVAVYNAVRAEGYDKDIALQFWDMLDTNQNGQLTKKELKAAIGAFPEPYRSNIRRSVSSAMGW